MNSVPMRREWLQDIWLLLTFSHQHFANCTPADSERALSTLQLPMHSSPAPIHAEQCRDETHTSYKQVYLHFDWSTDSRYRFLLHNSTIASAKYAFFFFLIHVQKKRTNKKTKSVAVFTHNWYASASNLSTSTRPHPSHQLQGQHRPSRMAALSVKRGNSHSPLKDKRSPQANWENSRLLKKKLGTPAAYQHIPPQGAEEF